jgi:hypothetical protein
MATNSVFIDDITLNIMQQKEAEKNIAGDFLNVTKLPDGDFIFRIIGPVKSCWEVWTQDAAGKKTKHVFFPEDEKLALASAQDQKPSFCFFFQAYCVKDKALRILTISQRALQKELIELIKTTEGGLELSTCVITKKSVGEKFPVYSLAQATTMSPEGIPVPYRSPLPKEAQDLLKTTLCDLGAVYERKAPFLRIDDELNK